VSDYSQMVYDSLVGLLKGEKKAKKRSPKAQTYYGGKLYKSPNSPIETGFFEKLSQGFEGGGAVKSPKCGRAVMKGRGGKFKGVK
jgi:hypothetical protein